MMLARSHSGRLTVKVVPRPGWLSAWQVGSSCGILQDGGETMVHRWTVVLQPETEGGFSVFVPVLPGCASQGETKAEALSNIKEAIALYIEGLKADRQRVPPSDILLREVEVAA